MPETLHSPQNALHSVDWFKAKLQFEIGPIELAHLLEEKNSLLVVDVRDPDSYKKSHVKGAINIPYKAFPKRMSELPKDKTIVTYCYSIVCHLATKAALDLAHREYRVQELVGGFEEWEKRGQPCEGSEARVS